MKSIIKLVGCAAILIAVAACGAEETEAPASVDADLPPPPPVTQVADGEMCGGMAGLMCSDADMFCQYPVEAQCGAADQMGVCTAPPEICPEIYDPVCGCDDTTYGNACEAAANSVSVAYEGECRADG